MPPCKACYVCFKTERCVQRDDMQDVLEKVAACDVMVLASLTYFLTMSGQMKIFIDRLLPKWQNLDGKDAYVIVTGHDGKRGLKRTAEDMVAILENLGDRVKQIIWGEHVWQKGEVLGSLVPFCTSGGSGFGRSLDKLPDSAPGANILEGLHVSGSSVDGASEEIASWIDGLNLA